MKLKKQIVRKKSESPNLDTTLDDFHDDDLFSNDEKGLPIQRNTANARERARMRVLSSAFYRLKTIIPWVPHDTKLSKLDTLRLARNYISYLSATLEGQPVNEITNKMPHPQKMTWPYIFQQVPDLNANKISCSSSPASTSSLKENTRKNDAISENFNNVNSYNETQMISYSPNFNTKCNEDYEFMN